MSQEGLMADRQRLRKEAVVAVKEDRERSTARMPSRVPGGGGTSPLLANEPDPVAGDHAGGVVRRAVVYDDDLVPPVGLGEHALDSLAHEAGLVVAGDDHGDEVCAAIRQVGHSRARSTDTAQDDGRTNHALRQPLFWIIPHRGAARHQMISTIFTICYRRQMSVRDVPWQLERYLPGKIYDYLAMAPPSARLELDVCLFTLAVYNLAR